ncbi:MAG: PqiC family protein [Syntrophobacteraceae bacterium]|nr:PqiC family protein [Syntrophobacteraceae bacterium]
MANRVCRFFALIFALAALGGCARSTPVNYYILRSLQGPLPRTKAAGPVRPMVVAVGPVTIAGYLDRPQIVTRSSPDTLQFAEFDRWAEPLDKNLARVLADDLSALLCGARLCVFPWPGSMPVRYQVTLTIVHLEKVPGQKVLLDASWNVLGDNGHKLLVMRRSTLREPLEAPGFAGVAAAESRAVKTLSRDIAAEVKSLGDK